MGIMIADNVRDVTVVKLSLASFILAINYAIADEFVYLFEWLTISEVNAVNSGIKVDVILDSLIAASTQ